VIFLALLALVLPFVVPSDVMPALCQVLIYIMLAVGLNLVVGLAGLLHLGYAAFFAIGAFSMAYLTSPQSPFGLQWGFWPGVVGATIITSLLGALVTWPTLKLRGDYLAIVTMGFGLMIDPILRNFDDQTKAITGMSQVAGLLDSNNTRGWYFFLLVWLALCVLLAARVRDSRLGRSLKAQRDDAVAAAACGIDLPSARLKASVLGAVIAGVAGSLYASYIYTVNLAFPMDFNGSIMILAMVILGGIGSLRGAVVGALVLGVINLVLTPAAIGVVEKQVLPHLPPALASLADPSKAQFMLFGLTLVVMMLGRPQGLLPEQKTVYKVPENA